MNNHVVLVQVFYAFLNDLFLLQRLSHLMELFPGSFNEKLCEQLLVGFQQQFKLKFGAQM